MTPSWRWIALAALTILLATTVSATARQGEQWASIRFTDQRTSGQVVLVDHVRLSHGGFVAIHDQRYLQGQAEESVLGVSGALGGGAHDSVPVALDRNVTGPEALIAMPHLDSNQNQVFDFPEQPQVDPPYEHDGRPVTDQAVVHPIDVPAESPIPTLAPVVAVVAAGALLAPAGGRR